MLLSEAETNNKLWRNMVSHFFMPFGVVEPMHARKFIIRNLGDPKLSPALSQWVVSIKAVGFRLI